MTREAEIESPTPECSLWLLGYGLVALQGTDVNCPREATGRKPISVRDMCLP